MNEEVIGFLFLLSRYLHMVATALLVGGTLFYELIVPVAIDDLKDEVKLFVFARARWAFRWIVWCSVVALLISGAVSTYRNWPAYVTGNGPLETAGYWWVAHVLLGLTGIIIAVALVLGRSPPRYPLVWMRMVLLTLLLSIFMASTTRHVRLRIQEGHYYFTAPGLSE